MEEDKILYTEFLKGNEEAFNQIIEKYKNNLIYFISRYVKNLDIAEDIFQDVIIYILENKEKYDFKYSLKTYLYTIAKSRAINYVKKANKLVEFDEEIKEEKLLEEIICSNERKEKINSIIKKLPKDYQEVIYLTKIEELSYKETGKIMDKTETQIKTLAHNAKTKLRKMLIKEKVIEMKNNKILKILSIILIISITISGIVYASYRIYENIKRTTLTPTYTGELGDTNTNNIWVGSFQLAWNEFLDTRLKGKELKFENYESNLANELNKRSFTKEMISEESYYIKVAETEPKLKDEIEAELKNKFNYKSTVLDSLDFTKIDGSKCYTLYSMLYKNFEFIKPFDKLSGIKFKDSEEWYKSFGIENSSSEELNSNVEVLYYTKISDTNLKSNDFAVKLKTKGEDEVIICRTDSSDSFEDIYEEINTKANNYTGNRDFGEDDELKIPYINVDTVINYDELCGKFIEGTNGLYLKNAMQNVRFSLNEKGGNLTSEASIQDMYLSVGMDTRFFYLNDNFITFLKEKDSSNPYFALRITNSDLLVPFEN